MDTLLPFLGDIWCLEASAYRRLSSLVAAWNGALPTEAKSAPRARRSKSVAVLPLHGLIEPRTSLWGLLFGGTSTEQFSEAFRAAMADDGVSDIVIDVDSPGGYSWGVQELSDEIYAARGQGKKIIAVAQPYAASAAYWIATAADRLVVMPSGEVGSVGVYAAHLDFSKRLEDLGIKETIITAKGSPYKAELADSKPLSDEAREHVQQSVDATYQQFVHDVARNRGLSVGEVREKFGKGRMVRAKDAVEAGMADRIGTLPETVERLSAGRIRFGAQASADDWRHSDIGKLRRKAALASAGNWR